MWSTHRARRGFTLVELLVVIAIIGTLVALLIPSLSSARSAANASASANNLSSFGRGFEVYASSRDGNYSSGAFDHFRDGDIRSNGWVGDLVGIKVANPGKALDPAHRSKLSETVGDYSGAVAANTGNISYGIDAGRWPAGTVAASVTGTAGFGASNASRDLWDEGYNTNYVTTWHFSRGDPTAADGFAAGNRGLSDGDGPLSQTILSQALTTAARIALMAPARTSGTLSNTEATALKTFTGNPNVAKTNDKMTASMTDGMTIPGTTANAGSAFVHSLQDVLPLHQPKTSAGEGGFAPVLFADLHVEKVNDTASAGNTTKGDGYLGNNGSTLDEGMYSEASDLIWLKRLRNQE